MMNSKQINCILTILQEGSIMAAGKKLEVSQSSLSRRVKMIECDFGAKIFDCSTMPISLTPAGQKYVMAARRMVDIERRLSAEIEKSKEKVAGKIRMGISIRRGTQLLPQVIPEFKKRYPFVAVELLEHDSTVLERLTIDGKCDLALVSTNRVPTRLNYALIEDEEVVLMAARSTDLAKRFADGMPIHLCEARRERFVCMRSGHSLRAIQDELFAKNGFFPHVFMETGNMEVAKRVTAYSDAVMLIPSANSKNVSEIDKYVQCHPILENEHRYSFYICFRKDLHMTRSMEDFVHIIYNELSIPFTALRESGHYLD